MYIGNVQVPGDKSLKYTIHLNAGVVLLFHVSCFVPLLFASADDLAEFFCCPPSSMLLCEFIIDEINSSFLTRLPPPLLLHLKCAVANKVYVDCTPPPVSLESDEIFFRFFRFSVDGEFTEI